MFMELVAETMMSRPTCWTTTSLNTQLVTSSCNRQLNSDESPQLWLPILIKTPRTRIPSLLLPSRIPRRACRTRQLVGHRRMWIKLTKKKDNILRKLRMLLKNTFTKSRRQRPRFKTEWFQGHHLTYKKVALGRIVTERNRPEQHKNEQVLLAG